MAKGIDFAFYPHPGITAIKADGDVFVCRYTSARLENDANGKNLTPSEKEALLAAGLSIVIVAEEGASRMLGGYAAGAVDARHADAVVKALGMAGLPVYFACDFDSTEGQQTAINAYLDGAASVIGRARVGIYGGYWPVKRALDAGKAEYAWQTYAWSGGQWDSRAQLRQVQNGVTIGGADCDRDTSMAADFGQFPRPAAPAPDPGPPLMPVSIVSEDDVIELTEAGQFVIATWAPAAQNIYLACAPGTGSMQVKIEFEDHSTVTKTLAFSAGRVAVPIGVHVNALITDLGPTTGGSNRPVVAHIA